MRVFHWAERLMGMNEASWARHANPWSGYSRFTVLPLLVLAIWSRDWIGWAAAPLVLLCLAWAWINPRAFAPPRSVEAWVTKGVFGERVFLNRKAVPIPAHHVTWAYLLTAVSAFGLPPLVWGLWVLNPAWTLLGLVLTMGGKVWFVDRMVWLWSDMKDADPSYEAWARAEFA